MSSPRSLSLSTRARLLSGACRTDGHGWILLDGGPHSVREGRLRCRLPIVLEVDHRSDGDGSARGQGNAVPHIAGRRGSTGHGGRRDGARERESWENNQTHRATAIGQHFHRCPHLGRCCPLSGPSSTSRWSDSGALPSWRRCARSPAKSSPIDQRPIESEENESQKRPIEAKDDGGDHGRRPGVPSGQAARCFELNPSRPENRVGVGCTSEKRRSASAVHTDSSGPARVDTHSWRTLLARSLLV